MDKVLNVGVCGIGSCASSLVQCIEFFKKDILMEGVVIKKLGSYSLKKINFSIALDVDREKIGQDLSVAIFNSKNKATKYIEVENCNLLVEDGVLLDGIEGHLSKLIWPSEKSKTNDFDNLKSRLRATKTDVLVCYLPTGATLAVQEYAKVCSELGIAFINATPEPVNNNDGIRESFIRNKVPLLGDDIKSHVGATTVHSILLELLKSKGVRVKNSYQLNIGGNMDFLNLSDPNRSSSKFKSKMKSLRGVCNDLSDSTYAGPSGYVEYLGDTKICHLSIECESVLNSSLSIEVKLKVDDSPNSAGVILQAVLFAGVFKDLNISIPEEVNSYLFKSPRDTFSKYDEWQCVKALFDEYGK
jgi:myo-inositol-1-phosphate synthase